MKLQKILKRIQRLHPKEIDLSLNRIKRLCNKLDNPQKKLKCITVVGTNGKYSTIQAIRAILKAANFKCNIYTSPHIQRINERFVYNDREINDKNLTKLLSEVDEANNGEKITFFEILTAAYFHGARKYSSNINLLESGLFHRFDATNVLDTNIASIITAIGIDHLDWLPKNHRNIKRIIFEKTNSLLNSKIIVSKQYKNKILDEIKFSLKKNKSKKIFFNDSFSYSSSKNNFFYYEDDHGSLKLPMPNLEGEFQLSNIATAISTVRNIDNIYLSNENIKKGITKIKSIARLQEIKSGKLKKLVKYNKILVDGSHNPLGAKVLADYLDNFKCNKHLIIGMMENKDHIAFANFFKNKIYSLTTIDIPNQKSSISGYNLMKKLKSFKKITYKKNIHEAIKSLKLKKDDIIIITGSFYLAGEILNLN